MTSTVDRPTVEVERPLSPYHTNGQTMAAALRKIADALDSITMPFAETNLSVSLQVSSMSATTQQDRRAAVEKISYAFGQELTYSEDIGHYGTGRGRLRFAPADLNVYGRMEPPAHIFAVLWDEAHAEQNARTAACTACGGEMVHRAGCPSEPEHLADHYAAECVDCTVPGGGHMESCAFASRVDLEAAAALEVVVLEVTPNPAPAPDFGDTLAALTADIDVPVPYTPIDPDAREYVPAGAYDSAAVQRAIRETIAALVHFSPQGVLAANWACGVDAYAGTTGASDPNCVTCPDCAATLALPQRIPGAALAAEPAPDLDEPTQQLPHRGNHVVPSGLPLLVNGHEPGRPRDHGPVPIVDVVTVDPDLDADERSGAEMARLNGSTS